MKFTFDNTYAQQMTDFYESCHAAQAPDPKLIKFNSALASQLGLNINDLSNIIDIFSGNVAPDGASPLAQVYAGHQFGGFSAQLGDGRALLLGEIVDLQGQRVDIQLKGSGRTSFSRGGDGKAALGPVLREYILCEAMHALGIPTSRALAAVTTGETVIRTEPLPGAVFTRVAASHIRIGTFQYFAARSETNKVKQLADYTIARHYPELLSSQNPYLDLLAAVVDTQASLVAQWMLVGFIHGVMNTDNMTVSGETIDYGPCAFMESYDPNTVYSSIDHQGRYAYQNQPPIAQWNLARMAETLLSLIDTDTERAIEMAVEVVNQFPDKYTKYGLQGMRAKVGLTSIEEDDLALMNNLLASMDKQNVDYTLLFRNLADTIDDKQQAAYEMFDDAADFRQWIEQWRNRLNRDVLSTSDSVELMNQTNPMYIARNHKVEEAIEAAVSTADYSKFEQLIETLSQPCQLQEGKQDYAKPAPKEFTDYKTFCGT